MFSDQGIMKESKLHDIKKKKLRLKPSPKKRMSTFLIHENENDSVNSVDSDIQNSPLPPKEACSGLQKIDEKQDRENELKPKSKN